MTGDIVGPSDLQADVFDSCPIAAMETPAMAHLWTAWRAREKGALSLVEPEPSAGFVLALDLLTSALNEVEARMLERARRGRQ